MDAGASNQAFAAFVKPPATTAEQPVDWMS